MNIKDFIEKYKVDSEVLGLNNCFEQLEKLNIELKKIRKENQSKNDIEIIDPYSNETFYADPLEAQSIFDFFYQNYYYDFFLKKHEWCRKLVSKIKTIILSDNKDYEFSTELSSDFFKTIIFTLKSLVKLPVMSINYEVFLEKLKKNFTFVFYFDENNNISEIMLSKFIEEGFFLRKENQLYFSDDSLRLDLVVISLNAVQIFSPTEKFTPKYSCYYGLSTLYFVLSKYMFTINYEYKKHLLSKYSNDIEKYFFLENTLGDYTNLNFFDFNSFRNNDYDYLLITRIYVDKLTLNEYCFQTIINSCFKNYFHSSRVNILHGRNFELAQRLIP